jgi:hypothetical protein
MSFYLYSLDQILFTYKLTGLFANNVFSFYANNVFSWSFCYYSDTSQVDVARAQAEEIDYLRQELDKMRQRTFPSFVRATKKRINSIAADV